jgi:hypothetical protein
LNSNISITEKFIARKIFCFEKGKFSVRIERNRISLRNPISSTFEFLKEIGFINAVKILE